MVVWVTLRSRRAWPCHMSGMIRSPWGCWGAVVAAGGGGGASRRSPTRRAVGVCHGGVGVVLVAGTVGDGAFSGLGALVGVELLGGDGHGHRPRPLRLVHQPKGPGRSALVVTRPVLE